MPARCATVAGISTPPRSVRRKRIPKSAGAGFSESVTLFPECRPIPVQEIGRRNVCCPFISDLSERGGYQRESNGSAEVESFRLCALNRLIATVCCDGRRK